jgi:WD40 repeat protein/DNA-binding SARP family transcriptional activator
MGLEFRVLGPLEVVGAAGPVRLGGRKQRAVLAILLLHANRVVPVEEIASGLYGEDAPATAVGQVRDHVSQLRKLFANGGSATDGSILETRAPGYLLRVEREQFDAALFEGRTNDATVALDEGEAQRAADWLREALGLWRGPPLADFTYESFAQPEIARLEELRLLALERRIEADLALGRDGALVGEVQALVREHPLREQFRLQLMLALYRSGRQAEALEAYHAARRTLVDELGIEPSEALRDLAGKMLRHDPSLAVANGAAAASVASAIPSPVRNPYKGLRAFDEPDAPDFFGREALVAQLLERLEESRFIAVVGPSGSGKSSVGRAGLVPAVRGGSVRGSESWRLAELTPGAYPLEELEAALLRIAVNPPSSLIEQVAADDRGLLRAVKRVLPSDRSELLLIVDQLEELFTLVEDEAVRVQVLALLERAVRDPGSRLRVIVTLRADFYDRPLLYRGFAELMREGVVTVAPLSPDEIERAVAAPAQRAGIGLEQGLLAEIVADVLDEPGALPLLQYALTELFDRRDGAHLTRAAYAEIGGVSGALARRAEELYAGLDAPGRDAARQLFLQLVTLGEPADTRRRVGRVELDSLDVDADGLAACIDVFGASRLLSFDRDPRAGPTVEIAHEALLTEWARLREWIDAARDDVRRHLRLAAAAAAWDGSGRDASFLLRGTQLAGFETWAASSGLAQTDLERAFLRTSLQEREAERLAEESRRAHEAALERRSVNRLRAIVAVLGVAAAVAIGLTVFAFDQRGSAKREARISDARELAAASVASLDVDPELSILLARQAVREAQADGVALPDAADALHQAVATSRVVLTIRSAATTSAAYSPNGTRIATAGSGKRAYLWNASNGERLLTLKGASSAIAHIAFSPDGTRVVTGSENGRVIVWQARTGKRLGVLQAPGTGDTAPDVAFSPDGSSLGTVDTAGHVTIWDARRLRATRTIRGDYSQCGIAWSLDGRRIGVGRCDAAYTPAGRIWDVASGRLLFTTRGYDDAMFALAFSPDGRHVATGGFDGLVRIWDVASGRLVANLRGHTGSVLSVAYSPDGSLLATAGTDATARVWDARRGVQLLVLQGHHAGIHGVQFAPDGRRLLTAGADGTARVWDVSLGGGRDWLTLSNRSSALDGLAFTPDGGRLLATGLVSSTPSARISRSTVWNARTGNVESARLLTSDGGLPSGYNSEGTIHTYVPTATSPDGSIAAKTKTSASGSATGTVEVYDAASQRVLATLVRRPTVSTIAFAADGQTIVTGYVDGTARDWDVSTGRPLHTFAAHSGAVQSVAFSPDGTLLATGGDDTTAKLWDLRTDERLLTLRGQSRTVTALAFNPDGTRLAAGSADGIVRVYVIPIDELMAISRERLTRGWTAAECARYLREGRCPREP